MDISIYYRLDMPWLDITIDTIICDDVINLAAPDPLHEVVSANFRAYAPDGVPSTLEDYNNRMPHIEYRHLASTTVADHDELIDFLQDLLAHLPSSHPELFL